MAVIINNVEVISSAAPSNGSADAPQGETPTPKAPSRLSTIDLRLTLDQQVRRARRLIAH